MQSHDHEKNLKLKGYKSIAGLDEVGRGCLAGPVVAAAVILPDNCAIRGIRDSKKLSAEQREVLAKQIHEQAIAVNIQSISSMIVDEINILQASLLAMKNAVEALLEVSKVAPDYLLIDGNKGIESNLPQDCLIQGEDRSQSIAAASIVAKVWRDAWMVEQDSIFPGYSFARHKGYGTQVHKQALKKLGPCPLHRRSFAPVAQYFK